MKKTISIFIAAAMLGVMPGFECYRAAAVTLQTQVRSGPYQGGLGAAGAAIGHNVPSGLSNLDVGHLGLSPRTISAQIMPQVQANVAKPQAVLPAGIQVRALPTAVQALRVETVLKGSSLINAEAPTQKTDGPQTAIQGLAQELPDFGRMNLGTAKVAADQDFMSRVAAFAKKGMPDSKPGSNGNTPDPDGSAGDLDNLGNPNGGSRDDGPDSGSGDFDGGGRGSGLFSGLGDDVLALPAIDSNQEIAVQTRTDDKPVELIVVFSGAAQPLSADEHLSLINFGRRDAVKLYTQVQKGMLAQIEAAGLQADILASYNATPVATYARINAATIKIDAARARELRELILSKGFKVYDNSRREIIRPVPIAPEDMDPEARNPVSMDENLAITNTEPIQKLAQEAWGPPDMGFVGRLVRRLVRLVVPQPAVGVIDTGVDLKHPLLKRVKAMVNATDGPNVDDNGHGSWVTSMILNYAPWLKSVTHYKTFVDGGATLDDILKALTMAGNDGNLVISNSWGSDEGDPESPDSQMVRKLAEQGHVMVFAAGNAGPSPNTIGSPAIVAYRDPATSAPRVLAVAATDRDKKVVYFSSRGPGSYITRNIPGYPHRPDLAAVGYNTMGAWPTDVGGADKVDPVLGPLKAISGTSMSTPAIAGAIAFLAMLFGVTTTGQQLDAVVNAVMSTLLKTGQSADLEGEGFLNVEAAYQALKKSMPPVVPNWAARLALRAANFLHRQ